MDKSKRNRMAGNHPSYDKKGMSAQSRRKKIAYDTAYHKTRSRKKYRAELNKKNRESGTVGDGKDMSHTKSGSLVKESQNRNRARNGQGARSRLK